ncbi:flagellar biosynthesis protein FlhB [Helicobacter sp. 12S02634-8]|uniref:EscU/YscU/HrcU family type III secretion system export apparatus switch protein n=1 Tax=Helicobacter sp. 12S02634-8 TaxID=1476199 RepID=UPI000BA6082A|nr:EscU/YscU/HrcU family type III secretion system export apparatus switch protein [Helicobacter sp. 12S02634-8]PAF46627.1 flagellar biosynthesis protein FlhB [Helicobacter sp. 12S02634-8]
MPSKLPKAIALAYHAQETPMDNASKVVASGVGAMAKQIIAKAKEFDIPIFANPALANSLIQVPLDSAIPSELYASVVEIFIWLQDAQENSELSKPD